MITLIAGARPNFVKIAPIQRELDARRIQHRVVHTGQHTGALDIASELGVRVDVRLACPAPDVANIARAVRDELVCHTPTCVVVVGDVTSTFAATIAAYDLGIPVVHVEAGLRSGDWTMPEEWHRVAVDGLAALCLTSSRGDEDGLSHGRFRFVGNVMIDSLRWALARQPHKRPIPGRYAVVTLHRPGNVDGAESRQRVTAALAAASNVIRCVWPVHPRARAAASVSGIDWIDPLGYVDFVHLLKGAAVVLTDSGGVQEEATALGIPCLTLRETTERPVTVREGTNRIVGLDPGRIEDALASLGKVTWLDAARGTPEGWDGHAAPRIVTALEEYAC